MANRETDKEIGRPDRELVRLVDRLMHWWPWTRKAAKQTILARGHDLTAPLLDLFDHERKRQARRSKHYNRFACGVLALTYLCVAGAFWCFFRNTYVDFFGFGIGAGIPILTLVLALRGLQYNTKRQAMTAYALALLDDLRAIGPLAEALEFRETMFATAEPRRHTIGALTRLLPQIGDAHTDLLDAKQRACLVPLIDSRSTELAVVVLNVFRHVGTSQELPAVRRCAKKEQSSPDRKWVRMAARRCLPILEERAREEKNARTLLRPSQQADATASDVLLRAASGGTDREPEHLLRASSDETN